MIPRYVNGRVFTGDPDLAKAWAEAFADRRRDHRLRRRDVGAPDADTTVDLKGRLVLPGFTDAHTHLLMIGRGARAGSPHRSPHTR